MKPWLRLGGLLLVLLVANWVAAVLVLAPEPATPVSYTFLLTQVQRGNVATIMTTGNTIEGTFAEPVAYVPSGERTGEPVDRFTTRRPSFADDNLFALLQANGVPVNEHPPDAPAPLWQRLLIGAGPALLLFAVIVWLLRRRAAGGPGSGPRTTFADVAGIEQVPEVAGIVDVLRDPERYRRLGARIPHGVLLTGPPGTGKTLLARAVAGEAEVPLLAMTAGANPVGEVFDRARRAAPAIVHIDELDGVGPDRGAQICAELDRLTGSEAVVVLAATHRPEVLDPALLRPGRFDRRVTVGPPDRARRRQILEMLTRGVPVDPDVDLPELAAATAGLVGADLQNLVNEAALRAARRRRGTVTRADFTDALDERTVLTPEEKERAAVHQSGHALLGMLTPGAGPVGTISILPLGGTGRSPAADRYESSIPVLRARIVGALGGRAAEQVVLGEVSTGAERDLDRVSSIARQMVGRWGMSDAIGPVSVLPPPGRESPAGDGVAAATRELADAEVRTIIEECHAEAVELLRRHRDRLNRLAHALREAETLDEDAAYAAAGISRAPAAGGRGDAGKTVAESESS